MLHTLGDWCCAWTLLQLVSATHWRLEGDMYECHCNMSSALLMKQDDSLWMNSGSKCIRKRGESICKRSASDNLSKDTCCYCCYNFVWFFRSWVVLQDQWMPLLHIWSINNVTCFSSKNRYCTYRTFYRYILSQLHYINWPFKLHKKRIQPLKFGFMKGANYMFRA